MAQGAADRLREVFRFLSGAAEASSVVRIASTEKRMVGFNAGLPQGGFGDKALPMSGAIPLRGEAPSDYQRNGTTVRVRGFEQHPVVQACIRAIVDIASAVPFQVYRKDAAENASGYSADIQVLTHKHPLQQLLDAPNAFLSAQRFRALMMTHYCIYGNAITFLERPEKANGNASDKPPVSLRLVHPEDLTTVYVNVKGYPLWYLWRDALGYPHTSPVTDLLHVRDLNAKGLVFGYPRAASALNDIIGDNEASQYVRQVVTNNGQPSGYALVNDETTVEEAKAAEEALYEKMVTRGNRGRFVFMGGVKDVKTIAFNLRDLEFPDLRRVAREDICAAFGVDPRMIGITSASKDAGLSGTQYVEARVRLIKQTIEPMMRAMESEMNLWLAPEFGDVYVRFDPDALAALNEDKMATSTRVLAEVAGGIRTIEEAREAIELHSDFDETDTLAIPMGTKIQPVLIAMQPVALGPDGQPLPPATPPTSGAPSEEPSDDKEVLPEDSGTTSQPATHDDTTDPTALLATNPNDPKNTPKIGDGSVDPSAKKRSARVTSRVLTRGVALTSEQRNALWQQFDVRAANEEGVYKRQALVLFGEERNLVSRIFERAQHAAGTARATPSANEQAHLTEAPYLTQAAKELKRMYKKGGEVEARWTDKFRPLIGETFAKGARHVEDAIGTGRAQRARTVKKPEHASAKPKLTYTFQMDNPNVREAILGRAVALAQHVSETTARGITDVVELGLKNGLRLSEIATLIDKTVFGGDASSRSEMIARTETVGAMNNGEFTVAADGGLASKEWLTQGDDRVRDSHYMCEVEGQIPIDEQFATGMLYPCDPNGDAADVINCRCTLLYYDTLNEGAQSVVSGEFET